MRHVLVDGARRRRAQKYGADAVHVSLADAEGIAHEKGADLVALDDALNELATFDERQSKIVELRFFGRLSLEEIAEALKIPARRRMVYAAQRKRTETLQTIKKLEEMAGGGMGQAHNIAKIYSTPNEKELALQWLERGLTAGTIVMFYKDDPIGDALRNDVGFSNLLQRMNLPQ